MVLTSLESLSIMREILFASLVETVMECNYVNAFQAGQKGIRIFFNSCSSGTIQNFVHATKNLLNWK